MKFSCEKAVLSDALATVLKAVPSKSPISSLEGVLFNAEGNSLKLTGFDLKKAIYTVIDADVAEPGACCLNARFFSEMIRRLGDGIVTITSDDNNSVEVKCGMSKYDFISLEVNEYPEIPTFSSDRYIEIPQNILSNMIEKTIFAVSKEEVRPIYTGSLFEVEGDTLNVVSIDGYRLARRTEKIENTHLEDCSFVVPGNALSDIQKICSDCEDNAVISIGEKHISFNIGTTVLISRRLEGEFMNHKKSVPDTFRKTITVERSEFISSIDRIALMLSEKNGNPVRLTFNDGTIDCLCATPIGKAQDLCTCVGDGEGMEIGFNDRYLIEALKAADGERVQICLNTSSSPCVIKASDGSENYTYMILPVRLRA